MPPRGRVRKKQGPAAAQQQAGALAASAAAALTAASAAASAAATTTALRNSPQWRERCASILVLVLERRHAAARAARSEAARAWLAEAQAPSAPRGLEWALGAPTMADGHAGGIGGGGWRGPTDRPARAATAATNSAVHDDEEQEIWARPSPRPSCSSPRPLRTSTF